MKIDFKKIAEILEKITWIFLFSGMLVLVCSFLFVTAQSIKSIPNKVDLCEDLGFDHYNLNTNKCYSNIVYDDGTRGIVESKGSITTSMVKQ